MLLFFFFKLKTVYEMRISDWSSDVCSSDLQRLPRLPQGRAGIMANADKPATDPVPQTPETAEASATPESRREVGRRNINHQIAQRQKALLAGVGAIALVGGEIGRAACRERVWK